MYNKRILFVAAHCNVFDGCFFVISRVPADKYAYCPVCSRCCKPITQKLIYYTPVDILALGQKKIKSFRYQVVEIQMAFIIFCLLPLNLESYYLVLDQNLYSESTVLVTEIFL